MLAHALRGVLMILVCHFLISQGNGQSENREPYRIFLRDAKGLGWRLGEVDGQWYFDALRPRGLEKNEDIVGDILISRESFFIESAEGGVRFRREEFGGYLAGDYSTDPPSVVINSAAVAGTVWIVHEGAGEQRYVENVNDTGKKMWLSMRGKGVVYPALNEEDKVYEYRRAILSADEKQIVKLVQRSSSK